MDRLRQLSLFRCRWFRTALLLLFPPTISFLAEAGHTQDLGELWRFSLDRAGTVFFSWTFIAAIFWVAVLLTKRAWIGGGTISLLLMVISTVDYYKFRSNGSHFIFSDLKILDSISGLGEFTNFHFSPVLFLCWLAAAAAVFLLWCADIRFTIRRSLRWVTAGSIVWAAVSAVCVPEAFTPVCRLFGLDNTYTYNVFGEAERFDNNNLISNFVVSINQHAQSAVDRPPEYSGDVIETMIGSHDTGAVSAPQPEVKPNVLVIMSETFCDFRALDSDPALDEVYAVFDRILSEENTCSGRTVVPTFGGGTVKTEFELLFGLPLRALNNPYIPHKMLEREEAYTTFPQLYSSLGYSTAYIHPYYSYFYDREDTYPGYGFDRLLFLDDLTVPVSEYNGYVDDATLFAQMEQIMEQTEGPDYIHVSTMQNHMPYGTEEAGDEYSSYLKGVQLTCEVLDGFLHRLEESGEPTVVLFTGDHLPYFTEEGNIYEQNGITGESSHVLYEQTCFIRSTGELPENALPDELFSAFYLPHLVYRAAGLPEEAFISAMLHTMEDTPVYSVAGDLSANSRFLDLITYDRVLGESYSRSKDPSLNF